MDSFVFVQIASLCLSDKKDVPLYLTFHIPTLTWARGWQRQSGCQLALLRVPSTLRKATALYQAVLLQIPVLPQGHCQALPSRRTFPHCKANETPTHPTEPQSHGYLYSTSHSSVGFSRMCPKPVLNGCLPSSHTAGRCSFKPSSPDVERPQLVLVDPQSRPASPPEGALQNLPLSHLSSMEDSGHKVISGDLELQRKCQNSPRGHAGDPWRGHWCGHLLSLVDDLIDQRVCA